LERLPNSIKLNIIKKFKKGFFILSFPSLKKFPSTKNIQMLQQQCITEQPQLTRYAEFVDKRNEKRNNSDCPLNCCRCPAFNCPRCYGVNFLKLE